VSADYEERRIRLTPASDIRMRPVRWVWQDRMPTGAITLIPGREGIGKSLVLVWLTARLTRGELPGIWHGTPKPVMYAATEDSWAQTVAPRLAASGADLHKVYRVDVVVDDGALDCLTLPRDCGALGREIKEVGAALLALDPLMSTIAAGIDTHRDRELRTALEPLAAMADDTGIAVAGLAHFNKSSGTDALNLITGSRAFSATARAVFSMVRDPENENSCVLSQSKNNLGRLDLPSLTYAIEEAKVDTDEGPALVGRLVFTGESDRSVSDILSDNGEDPHERADAAAWLRSYLTDNGGEAEATDVLKAGEKVGFSKDSLKRAKIKKGLPSVISRKEAMDAGWMWVIDLAEGSAKGVKGADSRK
jgi:RecA-family ATPase